MHSTCAGVVQAGLWLPGRMVPRSRWCPNTTLYGAVTIRAHLLRKTDDKDWSLSTAYIEFETNGGAAVTPPSFALTEGRTYYDALVSDPNRDYLRVPIHSSSLVSTDDDLYPDGNKILFIAVTSGSVGIYGTPFTAGASSRVYGGALVATPVPADPTRDLVHSRFYFTDAADQQIKPASGEIYLSWPLTLS